VTRQITGRVAHARSGATGQRNNRSKSRAVSDTAVLVLLLLGSLLVSSCGRNREDAAPPRSTPTPARRDTGGQERAAPAAVLATLTPTPKRLAATPRIAVATFKQIMNVRAGPSIDHPVIGTAAVGQQFAISGKNAAGDWWKISFSGRAGWVFAPLVTAANTGGVRIAASIPTPPPAPTAVPQAVPQVASPGVRGDRAAIIHVVDGDTLDVRFDAGHTDRIRLFDIDTPETFGGVECYGRKASEFTGSFNGQTVGVESRGRDKYDRLLAYIWLADGRLLNEELTRQGFAEYNDYGNPGLHAARVRASATQAQSAGAGMWSQCTVAAPNAAPLPAAATGGQALRYDPNGPDRDCGEFDTHQEAQAFFLAAGGPGSDPHRLDRDKNGISCESLP
jgi:micrococcal nuclease